MYGAVDKVTQVGREVAFCERGNRRVVQIGREEAGNGRLGADKGFQDLMSRL
jgi:hypothetical protein